MNESFILITLGLVGVLFHCLGKMKTLYDSATSANLKFNWWEMYVKKDLIAIIMSFLSVLIWYLCFGEVGKKYPIVSDLKRVSFLMAGMVGSYIIQLVADWVYKYSARRIIQKFVDVKTNVSDIVTGPTKTVQEIIEKGTEATGVDVSQSPPAPKTVEGAKEEVVEPLVK